MKLHELQQPKTVSTRNQHKDWARACRDKQQYFSKTDAAAAVPKDNNAADFEPYRCTFCQSWHLGHSRRYYRQLRGMSGRPIPKKDRNVYLNHIRRLQEQNRELVEMLMLERRARRQAYVWYMRRLRSRFWGLLDIMLDQWKHR